MLWVVWQTFAIGWTDRQTDRERWKGLIGGYSDKRDTTAQKLLSTKAAFHGLLLRTCSYLYNKSQTSTTTNRYVFMYTSIVVTTHDHQ